MSRLTADVAVLGAGIVGVCAALHLQQRGLSVALIDRRGAAGLETSFGNTGIIERASVEPYVFPRKLGAILKYALNRSSDARYHLAALPFIAPWLWRYFRASAPQRAAATARAALPLIERCLMEHEALMAASGAGHLLRKVGWIQLYRSEAARVSTLHHARIARELGLGAEVLDADALARLEPALRRPSSPIFGGVHLTDPGLISDPAALTQAYAAHFVALDGRLAQGDARSLEQQDGGWQVMTRDGPLSANRVVVALGPWSNDLLAPLGYRLPLGVKRGYHMHYAPQPGAALSRTVLDTDGGYCLAPMARGIRLTTGAEFARRDAPPTPVQIDQCEPMARRLLSLAQRLDNTPWMGRRPCLPDMLPVIGQAPRHKGLWFNFGHQHHGLTLGPVTGRLLAEMMTGAAPFTDPAPYRSERFG